MNNPLTICMTTMLIYCLRFTLSFSAGRGKEEEENMKRWRKREGRREEGTGGLGVNR